MSMALRKVNNHLAIHLHRLLAEENGNVFFSPFSISIAMAMVLSGAEGTTEAEMRTALGYDKAGIEKDSIATVFEQYLSTVLKKTDSYNLACANSMLNQKGFEVKDQYKSILADSFKALLMEVDFQKEAGNVINQINEWVNEKTNNMIPKLVDSLDTDTIMLILNAVYFKGRWLYIFNEEDTYPEEFFNKGLYETETEVDMMHMTDEWLLYTENKLLKALQLPYLGEEVAMLILLPHENDGLATMESTLTPSFIQDLKKNMHNNKVKVYLPKFQLEYSKSLVPYFKRLGVECIFARGAELGIASDSTDLAVSEIFHKAVLVVNEKGSEAAAATRVVYNAMSFQVEPYFLVDHPFAFVIYDTRNDLILFMGRVEEL